MKFFWYTIPLLVAWLGVAIVATAITFSYAFNDPTTAGRQADVFVAVGFVTAVSGLVATLVGIVVHMVLALIKGEMS